jgi:hypothetical protein
MCVSVLHYVALLMKPHLSILVVAALEYHWNHLLILRKSPNVTRAMITLTFQPWKDRSTFWCIWEWIL